MKITLEHGDCISLMHDLPSKSIDCILTDLPYGKTACKWDQIIELKKMWEMIKRISKENIPILLFGIEPFSSYLRLSNENWYKYDWIWLKNTGTNYYHATRMPIRYTENIHVFFSDNAWYYPQKTKGHIPTKKAIGQNTGNIYSGKTKVFYKGGDVERFPKNIIEFKTVNNYKRIHPTEKPIDLMEYFISTYTKPGNTVLDFTCGDGASGIASVIHKCNYIGFDNGFCENKKSKYYNWKWIDITKDRIKKNI